MVSDGEHALPAALRARYQVRRFLGKGGAGKVYLADDQELRRAVAIKVLEGSSVVASASRFLAEAQALSQLDHPHVVRLYDFGMSLEAAYLVLEYVEGGSLADLVGEPLPPSRVAALLGPVLEALAHAHSRGILHRDVKPENVLLDKQGVPKLADFGLAKHSRSQVRTRTGVMVGTPEYMAPEIFRDDPVGPPADLYSWGCLLFVLSEGRLLHQGELKDIVRAVVKGTLPPEVEASPFRELLRGALEPDPARRADHPKLARLLAELLHAPRPTSPSTASVGSNRPGLGAPRTAPTRMASHAPVPAAPPPRGSFRRPAALGLGALTMLAVLVVATRPAPRTPATPPPAATAAAPEDLLARWRARLGHFDVPAQVRALHEPTYGEPPPDLENYARYVEGEVPAKGYQRWPGGERHQHSMADVRLGEAARKGDMKVAAPDLEALDRLLPALPHREAFQTDRAALGAFLRDRARPFEERLELYRYLQALSYLDAYVEAWGRDRPYGVKPVMDELVPVQVLRSYPPAREVFTISNAQSIPRPTVDEPVLGPGTVPRPGRHLLYHWATDPRRQLPYLVQDPKRPSEVQRVTMGLLRMVNLQIGVDDSDLYGSLVLELNLGAAPQRSFQRLALRIVGGNLLQPDALRLDWNQLRVLFHPPTGLSQRRIYFVTASPEYELEVDLPPDSWKPGANSLVIRTTSLPGLNYRQGSDVYSIHLQVEGLDPG